MDKATEAVRDSYQWNPLSEFRPFDKLYPGWKYGESVIRAFTPSVLPVKLDPEFNVIVHDESWIECISEVIRDEYCIEFTGCVTDLQSIMSSRFDALSQNYTIRKFDPELELEYVNRFLGQIEKNMRKLGLPTIRDSILHVFGVRRFTPISVL